MAKPINSLSIPFSTQGAALDYFKAIKDSHGIGEKITDPVEEGMLIELLALHPDASAKAGVGVLEFFVDPPPANKPIKPGSKCIWIRRIDGTKVEMSYREAVKAASGADGMHRASVKNALRGEVDHLRIKFRKSKVIPPYVCPRSGKVLNSPADAKVVYENPSWDALTEAFVLSRWDWAQIETDTQLGEARTGPRLLDRDIASEWVEYWKDKAQPVAVSKP